MAFPQKESVLWAELSFLSTNQQPLTQGPHIPGAPRTCLCLTRLSLGTPRSRMHRPQLSSGNHGPPQGGAGADDAAKETVVSQIIVAYGAF